MVFKKNTKNFGKFVRDPTAPYTGPKEETSETRIRESIDNDAIDLKYGFKRVLDHSERTGFLINMHTTEVVDEDKKLHSAVDYYFIQEDSSRFKVSLPYMPYFYILPKKDCSQEVTAYLTKKFVGSLHKVEVVTKEDLDLPNHLIGLKQRYLKLSFATTTDLMKVRKDVLKAVRKNREYLKHHTHYTEMLTSALANGRDESSVRKTSDQLENILDIREYDVPYHTRVSLNKKVFCGSWYTVKSQGNEEPIITSRPDIIETPDTIVLAFDIECSKLPLKFPDANSDQIIMISYMIDGQGFLITNREIINAHIEDFEYTPKPEFEGCFTVFNEPDEKSTLRQFFDHILDIKPHCFVTYNGDFFDWPFIETRAAAHGMDMKAEIGFSADKEGCYLSRPAMHMDCLYWVKRDSYLPVGSQNLKAVAKAKLRYDPVEVDPEDMCRLARDSPQELSNYSVSDAVATYYLYMKYVHPFIFALCTIIPLEPDEVLRKGSGTLCEALLMVEAYHANIIFPNKQESELNKLTEDGHVLDQETYVGGHVEALESGVFRADLLTGFSLDSAEFARLISGVERAMKHAIEEEEKIPMDAVTNFDQVVAEIKLKLEDMRDRPIRTEKPVIYHLDVGAMYPNIILTNRLQPSAMVNETVCAACDYNRAGATCQRSMSWMWRAEVMPAHRNEFQRIQQQLETEKFPPLFPGNPHRAFHQLKKDEQAAFEKKRLGEYCRKVYRKVRVTRTEERYTTICQKENSFYVDTVRAFRDRRYEYKGLNKVAKKQVADAVAKADAAEIKSAKNREILYDSLQLAHKCILNSFYGYVMRKGARWYSMEMAGIVCYTGAAIIKKAREIIEKVGRPLELDTDGIWCMLPESFPENYVIETTLPKRSKVTISYTNAVLNSMVKDNFTNHVYHELTDKADLTYVQRSENSIFFEVDGPYLAMVLPASKEEGKRLKKRYAVFNYDGSLAELKGFEVKRRGELQLIKIFQSSVFDAFLKGDSLEQCYKSVAKVADYWLDVLFSKGCNMPDSELFELVSENRSMSRKLEDYGAQKSTSISTAKRLAEFLGDQMVKDAGLACKFVISKKPDGAPVTERAIPLAIFQSEPSVKRHYLRKWLKDSSINDIDIRQVLDWGYYIERLGGSIQKIITIPAAMQGVANPVPRIRHPDWLHKKMLEKNDTMKQRKISDMFIRAPIPAEGSADFSVNGDGGEGDSDPDDPSPVEQPDSMEPGDIEDIGGVSNGVRVPVVHVNKRKRPPSPHQHPLDSQSQDLTQSWLQTLGPPPPFGNTSEERLVWLTYHKKKWAIQTEQRLSYKKARGDSGPLGHERNAMVRNPGGSTLGGFLRRAQRTLLDTPWQILQIAEQSEPGLFKLWALVGQELHQIKLTVPRVFYVNQRQPRADPEPGIACMWKKCVKILPRSRPVYNLYQFTVPEPLYRECSQDLMADLSTPDIEGIYETQVTPEFRAFMRLGCACVVDRNEARRLGAQGFRDTDSFSLSQLALKSLSNFEYLPSGGVRHLYLYHARSPAGHRAMYGLFLGPTQKAHIFLVDTVRTNQMPDLAALYSKEWTDKMNRGKKADDLPPNKFTFEVRVETDLRHVHRLIQRALQNYRDDKRGPSLLAVQSPHGLPTLLSLMPALAEVPLVKIHVQGQDSRWELDWQRACSKLMLQHFLNTETVLTVMAKQARYFHVPIGNLPPDTTLFGADLFYARHLIKNNFVLWNSPTDRPDLGGREADDNRLLTEFEESASVVTNAPGCYSTFCIELAIDGLAVNTLLQSHHVNDVEGTSSFVSFDTIPQASLEDMMSGPGTVLPSYDETALCSGAFKVLRSLVSAWLRDVSLYKNMFADQQLMHFYRWIRSPTAHLYDPALRRTLHGLMKKLFMQLVAEFKRLGSVIVYANFSKIILCTKKRSMEDAVGYVEFIVQSIRNKELFHSVEIGYSQSWEYLMWLDPANNAGVQGVMPAEIAEDSQVFGHEAGKKGAREEELNKGSDDEDAEDDGPAIQMSWNVVEYLPSVANCQESFSAVIAGYVSAVCCHLKESAEVTGTPRRRPALASQVLTPDPHAQLGLAAFKTTAEFAKQLITGDMADKLYKMTQNIHEKASVEMKNHVQDKDSFAFPLLPGSHLSMKNPALEFVKTVCKVLSLDASVKDEVGKLRRNMLRLINVGDFSDEATWCDPCVTFTLPEVICKACNHCRDIDLCKDNFRGMEGDSPVWRCPLCTISYDNVDIEYLLIDNVQRKAMAYTLQDLQCKKCLQIKLDNMSLYCTCAGEYRTLVSKDDLLTHLRMFRSIAEHFKMPLLLDVVDWNLTMNGS